MISPKAIDATASDQYNEKSIQHNRRRNKMQGSPDHATSPVGHIIKVSSREGLFESSPSSAEKPGHHVHTNMSKGALNMITQSEAALLWKRHKIAMNSVGPGYMSAAPEMRSRQDGSRRTPPLGFDDGAARVLRPVAMGEKGQRIWGRFLKHFGRAGSDDIGVA